MTKHFGSIVLLSVILIFTSVIIPAQVDEQNFVTYDIDNFWNAYDKITAIRDAAAQLQLLNTLFIGKGSPGLKAMIKARRLTPQNFLDEINTYPLFLNSVRANTLKAGNLAKEIAADVNKLKLLYPELRPSKIYFTFGALRSGGTTLDDMVLIGSDLALSDSSAVTTEFGNEFANIPPFVKTDPIRNIVHTNIHEYVHTQQKKTVANNLLGQSLLEGVAEFVANTATGRESWADAFPYGRAHVEQVRAKFENQMFNSDTSFWLYSNADNEFKTRDLGYYVGYSICERNYQKTADKKLAVKEMIELDYNEEAALEKYVQRSGYFTGSIQEKKKQFEKTRPVVTSIAQFKSGDLKVNPSITRVTVTFSQKMSTRYRNFELGPLGMENLLKVNSIIGYTNDDHTITFEVAMKPGRQYQLLLGDGFRNETGAPLKPYLIDIKTAAN